MTSKDYEAEERMLKLLVCLLVLTTFTCTIGSGIHGIITGDYDQFFIITFCSFILALPMIKLNSHRANVHKWAEEERQRGN